MVIKSAPRSGSLHCRSECSTSRKSPQVVPIAWSVVHLNGMKLGRCIPFYRAFRVEHGPFNSHPTSGWSRAAIFLMNVMTFVHPQWSQLKSRECYISCLKRCLSTLNMCMGRKIIPRNLLLAIVSALVVQTVNGTDPALIPHWNFDQGGSPSLQDDFKILDVRAWPRKQLESRLGFRINFLISDFWKLFPLSELGPALPRFHFLISYFHFHYFWHMFPISYFRFSVFLTLCVSFTHNISCTYNPIHSLSQYLETMCRQPFNLFHNIHNIVSFFRPLLPLTPSIDSCSRLWRQPHSSQKVCHYITCHYPISASLDSDSLLLPHLVSTSPCHYLTSHPNSASLESEVVTSAVPRTGMTPLTHVKAELVTNSSRYYWVDLADSRQAEVVTSVVPRTMMTWLPRAKMSWCSVKVEVATYYSHWGSDKILCLELGWANQAGLVTLL